MHGIVWWNCSSVRASAEKLLATGVLPVDDDHDRSWSRLITWQDQRCSAEFLAKCRMSIAALNSTAQPGTQLGTYSSPLATGYGLATFAHTLHHAPRDLVGMDGCGTIQDLVAFLLCGHTLPSQCTMDTTNACSWGGFDLQNNIWNPITYVCLPVGWRLCGSPRLTWLVAVL